MKYLQVLVVLIFICSIADGDPCAAHRDGCTTYVPLPYRGKFRASCNKHDICYSCSYRYGFTRADCDTRFYNGMLKSCGWSYYCRMWAYIYYKAVRAFGFMYHHGNKNFCHNYWVRPCMKK